MVARDKENLSGQQIGNYARDVKLERLVFLEVLRTTADEDENLAARFRRRMETVSQLKEKIRPLPLSVIWTPPTMVSPTLSSTTSPVQLWPTSWPN